MKVAPSPWFSLRVEEVSSHRSLDCPLYDQCLYYAACQHWMGFTCKLCSMTHVGWTSQDADLMGFGFCGNNLHEEL